MLAAGILSTAGQPPAKDHRYGLVDERPTIVGEWVASGGAQDCIDRQRVRRYTVLDDRHILFRLRGGKHLINRLDHVCTQLGIDRQFVLNTPVRQVCDNDTLRVLQTGVGATRGPICALGPFLEVEKRQSHE